jgi:hypothetical protein
VKGPEFKPQYSSSPPKSVLKNAFPLKAIEIFYIISERVFAFHI